MLDKTKVAIYKKGEEPSDVLYWLSRPVAERIKAFETICLEYNLWKYDYQPGLQRVYRVVKRKGG